MMRSMYSGVSGLRNHQTRMDVIGNNIANVNTAGFKKSRVVFKDMLYQNVRGASSPTGSRGGTNPMGVGLGMALSSIDQIHTGAPATSTGRLTDMAIDGNGYFVVNDGSNRYYTRAGAFDFDVDGNLINADGLRVQGWLANATNWTLDTNGDPTNISIAGYKTIEARPTREMLFTGNLDSGLNFTPARDEWQVLTFSAIPHGGTAGGRLNLTFNGETAFNVPVDANGAATATNIQNALEGLPNIGSGNVTVTWDAVRQRYEIKFVNDMAAMDWPNIEAIPDPGLPLNPYDGGTPSVVSIVEGREPTAVVPRNDIQILDLTQTASDGFTLTYGGNTIGPIAFNATAATIQAALNTSLGANAATVTEVTAPGASGGLFHIEFNTAVLGTNVVEELIIKNNGACNGTVNSFREAGYPRYSVSGSKDVYDSLGNKVTLYYRFFKYEIEPGTYPGVTPVDQPETRWACDFSTDPLFENQADYVADAEFSAVDLVTGTRTGTGDMVYRVYNIPFDETGNITDPSHAVFTYDVNRQAPDPGAGSANINCTINFAELTQRAGDSSAWAYSQDGYAEGSLTSYSVGSDGTITGVYNNGQRRDLARVAIASFENPAGLQQMGGTLFAVSSNSGGAHIGAPMSQGLGKIIPSSLEMSNVDLSEEFTDMIVTQRGFQANSRIITTSDEMLQELVNLKR
ncbi:MAG: flagellar hook protein FlgE [Syntrophomonadaceae bacterium]|nr:flagellar hook protein FlgE [Syntrophomonadaceae bacterium]